MDSETGKTNSIGISMASDIGFIEYICSQMEDLETSVIGRCSVTI